jgi:hypothetical protein
VASLRIWDALGFKRIGRVKGCGNLKSYPDQLIDAIIFGRELGGEGDEMVSEERFDKIRYYLKTGTYPNGSDRAEKSRLRSAATHYRLIPTLEEGEEDKLMLKGKEVVSDPHKQYDIARAVHSVGHGGINKTTASIAEKFHWVRIKETVSAAIRNCPECKDTNAPKPPTASTNSRRSAPRDSDEANGNGNGNGSSTRRVVAAGSSPEITSNINIATSSPPQQQDSHMHSHAPMANMQQYNHYPDMPVDPQLMVGIHHWETPQHIQPHPDSLAHQLQVQAQSGGEAMHLDSHSGAEHENDVSHRLREELEAQMMDQASGGMEFKYADSVPDERLQ